MKKVFFILAMLLAAATTFSQTSRRPSNPSESADTRSREAVPSGSGNAVSNSARSSQTSTERQPMQHNQNESRTSTNDDSHNASSRQVPVTSSERSENERVDDAPSESGYTPAYSTNSRQGQAPKSTGNRQGNVRENTTQPGSGNTPGRKNVTTGVTRNVPARHDGSVNQGSLHQSEKPVYNSPRRSNGHREIIHHYQQPPSSREYRSHHHPYRKPVHGSIFWTPEMRFEYESIYPMVTYWDYPEGYMIETISAYDAFYYCGEVANVYGRVEEVFYSRPTDEYILYFGAYYPYHDFTVVIPGNIARRFSYRPERYFEDEYVMVTGLVTMYNGVPEIYINRTYQIDTY